MPNCEDGIQHRLLSRAGRKQRVLGMRKQGAEHRRPQQHAADELAHDGRLAHPFHELAEEPAATIRATIWPKKIASDVSWGEGECHRLTLSDSVSPLWRAPKQSGKVVEMT